jgi:hypothetical protein
MDSLFENNYNISLGKIMLIFYVLMSSSALFPLLSKQWKRNLENDRLSQHLLGITTLLSIILLVSDGNFSISRIFTYTFIGYMWFIFSTKLDLQWNIIVLISLISFCIYQNIIKNKNDQVLNDKYLDENTKLLLEKEKKDKYLYITISIILLTIGGSVIYSNKKIGQHGGGYSLINFLLY